MPGDQDKNEELALDFTMEPTTHIPGDRRTPSTTRELVPPSQDAQLVILAGRDRGKRFRIGEQAVLGRHPAAEVWIHDEGVSGRHASIRRVKGQFVLRDLQSRNGVRVNGVAVQEHTLAFGDKISLGARTVLVFTYADPLEEQLLQLQKMEAIGQLAAGVAHEFNNLLAVVLTNLELLEEQGRVEDEKRLSDGEVRECITEARQAAGRGAELTRRMLDYSRLSDSSRGPVELSPLLTEVGELAARIFDRAIRIETDVSDDLRVHGDRLLLYQAVMNLLINAKDAMPGGGVLTLAGGQVLLEAEGLERLPNLAPGEHVVITVSDTGQGMDPVTLRRACDPFFTTKQAGEGTGLGLSMVRSIAHSHGGELSIDSEPGRGTAVRLYVPRLVGTADQPRRLRRSPTESRFTGTVLVIDDDLLVLRSLARTLRLVGFDVITAESGEAGLERFNTHHDLIRLVLLDVVMPGMGGEATLARLLTLDPNARVLVSSGFTQEAVIRRMLEAGALGFLRKPYELDELKNAIRKALCRTKTSDLYPQISR